MRVKTFLLRLLGSVMFWLVIAFASIFAILASLLDSHSSKEEDLSEYPSSVSFDVTVDASGNEKTTYTYTFDASTAGVGLFRILENDNKEVAIQCEGEAEQIVSPSPVDLNTMFPDDLHGNQRIQYVFESGKKAVIDDSEYNDRVVYSRTVYIPLPEGRQCTASSTQKLSPQARVYTDRAVVDNYFSSYESYTPMTAFLHLPVPEGENVQDTTEVAVVNSYIHVTPIVTAQDNTIVITCDDGCDISVAFPKHWLNEDVSKYDYDSSRYADEDLKKVPFTDEKDIKDSQAPSASASPSPTEKREDSRNADRKVQSLREVNVLWFAAFVIVLGVGFSAAYMLRKKKKDEIFSERYWRDVPDKDLDPVIVGRLWAHNSEAQIARDVPTIIMTLINKGAVTLKKSGGDSVLKRVGEPKATLTSIDTQALDIIFDKHKRVTLSELKKRKHAVTSKVKDIVDKQLAKEEKIQAHPKAVLFGGSILIFTLVALIAIFVAVDNDVFDSLLLLIVWLSIGAFATIFIFPEVSFAKGSIKTSWPFWLLAFIFVVTPRIPSSAIQQLANVWHGVMCELLAIAFVAFGFYAARRSARIEDIVAKAEGLKNWLEDFTLLDERPPSDVKVWGELMVYATAFGIADKVDKELDGLELNVFDASVLQF